MTHSAVEYTLDLVRDNWQAGDFGDIPLKRVDRDDSVFLDDDRRHGKFEKLQQTNYLGANYGGKNRTPIGTEYDSRTDETVEIRIGGLHVREHGLIDPDAPFPPDLEHNPVPWNELVNEVQLSILRDRTFPSPDTNISYLSLQIRNEQPGTLDLPSLYETTFEVFYEGYEDLP